MHGEPASIVAVAVAATSTSSKGCSPAWLGEVGNRGRTEPGRAGRNYELGLAGPGRAGRDAEVWLQPGRAGPGYYFFPDLVAEPGLATRPAAL